LKPELRPRESVFCLLEPGVEAAGIGAIGWFREDEGLAVIPPRSRADAAVYMREDS
jgi:hypothetical protein